MMKLTNKQKAFINEYCIDKNATQAAIRAGYSKKTAKSQGQRLLTNVDIDKEIDKILNKLAEKAGINAQWVIEGLKRNAIKAEEAEERNASISAYDKLGKHFGIYEQDNKQKTDLTVKSELSESQQEAIASIKQSLGL